MARKYSTRSKHRIRTRGLMFVRRSAFVPEIADVAAGERERQVQRVGPFRSRLRFIEPALVHVVRSSHVREPAALGHERTIEPEGVALRAKTALETRPRADARRGILRAACASPGTRELYKIPQQLGAVLARYGLRMKLHAPDRPRHMTQRHHRPVIEPCDLLQRRGQWLHHGQRMISDRGETIRNPAKQARRHRG